MNNPNHTKKKIILLNNKNKNLKVCSYCGKMKKISDFYKTHNQCKVCLKEKSRNYGSQNDNLYVKKSSKNNLVNMPSFINNLTKKLKRKSIKIEATMPKKAKGKYVHKYFYIDNKFIYFDVISNYKGKRHIFYRAIYSKTTTKNYKRLFSIEQIFSNDIINLCKDLGVYN